VSTEPVFYVSDNWVPASQAVVHIFDSGLMYGDCVTETLRTFERRPYEVERHLARMKRSLRLTRIELDPSLDLATLIDEMVARNRNAFEPDDELLLKVDVTRGVFGYYRNPGEQHRDWNLLLHVIRLPFHRFARQYDTGLAVAYPQTRQVPSQSLDSRIKHRSRLFQAISEREAGDVDPGAAALLLDTEGRLSEGTGWNLFLAREGRLFTPSSANCLEGISRSIVIELCAELGMQCVETDLWPYDLATADEAFASATSYCMLPITRVQKRPVASGRCGPITARLLAAWSARIGTDIAAQARSRAEAQESLPAAAC
jgi:branched-chain amino acid aminotransferase